MFESYPFTEVDVVSDRWQKILQWLALNLPNDMNFKVTKIRSDAAHGIPSYDEYSLEFSRPGFELLKVNAGLLLRGPSITLTELQVSFKFGDPTQPIFFDYIRETPSTFPGPTPLPTQPANPIGKEFLPGKFECVPGDNHPNGAFFTNSAGKTFKKVIQLSPFGPRPWWEAI